MEATGFIFDKSKIKGLLDEVTRRKAAARDYVFPLARLGFTDAGELVLNHAGKGFEVNDRTFCEWKDAEAYLEESRAAGSLGAEEWSIKVVEGPPSLALTGTALQQTLEKVGVPGRFYSYLTDKKAYNDVAGNLVRELLQKEQGRKVLVRTLDGRVRAVLSDRYKIMDNADLFYAAFEKFEEVGAEIWHARLWDDGMDLFGVRAGIQGEVTTDRTFDPGDGWQSRWYGKAGDVHNPAVRITNSETGEGGLNCRLAILRRVCLNFNVYTDGVAQVHLGKILAAGEGLLESDATRQSEGVYVWNKVKDAISTAFDPVAFQKLIDGLNHATEQQLPDVEVAVGNVVKEYSISEDRRKAIERALILSGDASRYGLIQAVTEAAHKATPAEAHKLDEVGGELASMADSRFTELVAA